MDSVVTKSLGHFASWKAGASVDDDDAEGRPLFVLVGLSSSHQSLLDDVVAANNHDGLVTLLWNELAAQLAYLCLSQHYLLLDISLNVVNHALFDLSEIA